MQFNQSGGLNIRLTSEPKCRFANEIFVQFGRYAIRSATDAKFQRPVWCNPKGVMPGKWHHPAFKIVKTIWPCRENLQAQIEFGGGMQTTIGHHRFG